VQLQIHFNEEVLRLSAEGHLLHQQLRVDARRPHEVLCGSVDVLVVDEPHEVRVVVRDLHGLFVDRLALGGIELCTTLGHEIGQRLVAVRRTDATGLVVGRELTVRIEDVVGRRDVDRIGAVVAVEENVEVRTEFEDFELDVETGFLPVAGDGLEKFLVLQPTARFTDELDGLAGDTRCDRGSTG